jgi:hypothetical protein
MAIAWSDRERIDIGVFAVIYGHLGESSLLTGKIECA